MYPITYQELMLILLCLTGIKDFVPLPNEDGYEGFGDLTDKANMWVKDQADIIVKNMQSLMVQKDDGKSTSS